MKNTVCALEGHIDQSISHESWVKAADKNIRKVEKFYIPDISFVLL